MSLFHSDPARVDALLRAIVGGAADRIAVIDAEYRFIGFNASYQRDFEDRFNCRLELGASFLELVRDRDCALATFGRALAGERHVVEQAISDGDRRYWYEIDVYPLKDGDRIAGAIHVARDITSRKAAHRELRNFSEELERQVAGRTEELRASEALVHKVLDSLVAFVGVLRPDGTVIDVNRGPLEVAGVGPQDVIGRKFWDCVWWSHSDELRERVRTECERAAQGEVIRYDTTARVAGSGRLMIDYMIAPLRGVGGAITHLVASAVDITERVRAQRDLANSTRLLNAIAEQTDDLLFVKDRDGRMVMANRATLQALGKDADHVLGFTVEEILDDPDEARRLTESDLRIVAGGRQEVVEEEITTGGSVHTWLSAKAPYRDENGDVLGLIGISRDITERKRAELTLLDADRRKDEFIATLAHELRNPLAPMLNAIQILQRDGDPDVTRQRAKDIIERQVHQMARLIDDLLDISRITLGKLSLRRELVELAAVVEEAIEVARPHIVACEHRLEIQLPVRPLRLVGDATRLAQVMSNLLINAAKYTPRRGRIWLSVEASGDEALIRVRDTGVGIAPESLPALFEKFSQVRSAQDRTGGGLGIGLALAQGLVHMHGGTISAASPGIGGGSEFLIRLPILAKADTGDTTTDLIKSATQVPVGGLKVLVADDNEDAVESAAMLLSLNGNDVKLASDGLEAVEAADRYRPDVVLLDIGMPKLNGFEACRRIRSEPWGKEMLVVAVTGWGQEEDRRRTAEAGFDAHFTKPVDFASVMALIGQRRAARVH